MKILGTSAKFQRCRAENIRRVNIDNREEWTARAMQSRRLDIYRYYPDMLLTKYPVKTDLITRVWSFKRALAVKI